LLVYAFDSNKKNEVNKYEELQRSAAAHGASLRRNNRDLESEAWTPKKLSVLSYPTAQKHAGWSKGRRYCIFCSFFFNVFLRSSGSDLT
jgi:hypothetical protein